MKHLVDIHSERCIGCTRCMRACPTEAIRIINNKASLIQDHCIYCGNCIINCHKSAYKVYSDSFANLNKYQIKVAIVPLAIFGMVADEAELGGIYKILYNYGFDEVFDLSGICSLLSEKVNEYIYNSDKTYILTHCPTIVRLIQLKYPILLENLLPFDFPFEIGAKVIRKIVSDKYQISEAKIGISYISECLSNFIAVKEPLGKQGSNIDNVFLFNDLIRNNLDKKTGLTNLVKSGVHFCQTGAYQHINKNNDVLTVDGIKQVDEVMENLYLNKINAVKLIEAYSCVGGCVGGNFTIENTFVAKWKASQLFEHTKTNDDELLNQYRKSLTDNDYLFSELVNPLSSYQLSNNIKQSLNKMSKINQILKQLPNIDCCACGSPSCHAFAEDVVNKVKTIDECHFFRKEK